MDFKIPSTFIRRRCHLTWHEVEFGLQNGWLTDDAAIDLAIDRVTAGDESADVVALASVLPHEKDKAPQIIRRLAERDPECSNEKWLFLLLAWLYEHRDSIDEPLAVVEQLYADFDYPEAMAGFVRYMPPQDPARVGEPYLLDAWRRFLDTVGRNYAPNQ
ncbi:MAG TPA: DUF2247 family protein [Thermoanaerobaculia bacterium]|nr:DUF2247 family protein [Thermoanaerobaculia bacterium]